MARTVSVLSLLICLSISNGFISSSVVPTVHNGRPPSAATVARTDSTGAIDLITKYSIEAKRSFCRHSKNSFLFANGLHGTSSAPESASIVATAGKAKLWNIPNTLTIARVFMLPLFAASYIFNRRQVGLAIYIVSSLTDLLDGYIARKYNQTSPFGAFLDPVADKLMVSTALAFLVMTIPLWWITLPVAIILCREISISALREWMAERNARASVQVGNLGKWKTALQMISIGLLLSCFLTSPIEVGYVELKPARMKVFRYAAGIVTFYIATFLTVVSGFQYFMAAWPLLKEEWL